MQKLTGIIILTAAVVLSSGCSYFGVYKRDLPQGNLITAGMVSQLQPGMSRNQVVNVMGTPLLDAPFNANQWDYVFRVDEAYGGVEQRRVTLTFDGDRLVDVARQGEFDSDIQLRAADGLGPNVEGDDPLDGIPRQAPQLQRGGTLPRGGETASQPLHL